MNRSLLCATLLALGACAPEGGNGNYLGTANQATAGVGASGQGASAAPFAGSGAPGVGTAGVGAAEAAGAGAAGFGAAGVGAAGIGAAGVGAAGTGDMGAAGMMAMAGAGGMGMAGTMATAGDGGMGGAGAAGMGGAGAAGMGGAGGMSGGNTPGTVTVQFTTVTYGGEYAPLNYGAVWFETPGGMFIKTAKRWAGTTHAGDLVAWTAASGGWGSPIFGGGNTKDMVDAMSSATLRTHQSHTVTWNMMNADKQLVPDGDYVAVIEMTEDRRLRRAGPVLRIPFTKGPMPQMVTPQGMASITNVSLSYQP